MTAAPSDEQCSERPCPERVSARTWVEILRRIRFGTVTVGGKRVSGRTIKAVGNGLAWYADGRNGTRVYPGIARVAVECEMDYKTVKRVYDVLRGFGLLELVSVARGPNRSGEPRGDEYRLAIPEDLLERLTVLGPAEHKEEIERVGKATQSTGKRKVTGSPVPRNPDPNPVDNPEFRGTQDPVTSLPAARVTGYCGTENPGLRGTAEPSYGVLRTPTSIKDLSPQEIDEVSHVPAQPPDARGPTAHIDLQASKQPPGPTDARVRFERITPTGRRVVAWAQATRPWCGLCSEDTRLLGTAKRGGIARHCDHCHPDTAIPELAGAPT